MSDNNNVVYDTEYDLFVYDSMGYNSLGYNSMGYNSAGLNIDGLNQNITTTSIATGSQPTSAYNIASLMALSLGAAASSADIAASAANLEVAAQHGFSLTSKIFGTLDIVPNIIEFSNEPNWTDGGQIILGVGLTFLELNPAVAIVGGVVLGGWELYEYTQENP